MLDYISTRRRDEVVKNFEDVVLEGLAADGGLYVPASCPVLTPEDMHSMRHVPYAGIAHRVIQPFTEGCIDSDALYGIIDKAYKHFDPPEIAPLVPVQDGLYVMELFHGPTLAFKDMALQFLGHLFDHILQKRDKKLTIVGATSGDTGSAAIEACRDKDTMDVFMLHPKGRVSDVQRRQMTTVLSPNIHNIAIEGSFDDCQDLVKALFADQVFRAEANLSAVNSINWGRIVAQIAYYVYAYLKLAAEKGTENIVFAVPTGNFGNVYAGYVASSMGVPVKKLLIGTNSNDILFRFLESGTMKTETVIPTISPSMDIQISSNFERVLFDLYGRDGEAVTGTMKYFRSKGPFALDESMMTRLHEIFAAYRFDDAATKEIMRHLHNQSGYIADPHSAIGIGAAEKYMWNSPLGEKEAIVALATAHPAKFPAAVEDATGYFPSLPARLAGLHHQEERLSVLPNDLQTLKSFIREQK